MEWPAYSPDLNPPEHVWNHVWGTIRRRRGELQTLGQLQQALLEEWERTDQQVIIAMIDSMSCRLQVVIAARGGGNTRSWKWLKRSRPNRKFEL